MSDLTTATTPTRPTFLGEVDIPRDYNPSGNKAQAARTMLEQADKAGAGKAVVFEFRDKKEAELHRSMLYSMSILRYGEAGKIGTRIMDSLLYVWKTEKAEG